MREDSNSESWVQPHIPDEIQSIETIEQPPQRRYPSWRTGSHQPLKSPHLLSPHVVSLLIPFSIFGTLARLGLQALGTYEGNSIFSLAYAQAVGCLIMGLALGLKDSFSRFYPPLYTAITTGFCGSLTTFSGWQLDIFDAWINPSQFHRSGFYDFIDGTGRSVFTLCISLASVSFGQKLASIIIPHLRRITPPDQIVQIMIIGLSAASYAAVFLVYFFLPIDYRHQVTAALLFAFPGTLTRYLLSIHLNTLVKIFPLGTFVANSMGTALLGGFTVLKNISRNPVSLNTCSILQGLSDGYCGCLTTVSTFAVEVGNLQGWRGSFYALVSWSTGQLLLVAILGASIWSGHAEKEMTCRFS